MEANQYFWKDGREVGRAPVGRLQFDAQPGHLHWHFEQFARYSLVNASKHLVRVSEKRGFCIEPTDAIDLTMDNAAWTTDDTGLSALSTNCASVGAIWAREALPVGWGDTYLPDVSGQAIDITHIPNGVYYIKIDANPFGKLYEVSRSNDSQLRRVVLPCSAGHRWVYVPPWHGIKI
jgi:hypothetical protein